MSATARGSNLVKKLVYLDGKALALPSHLVRFR